MSRRALAALAFAAALSPMLAACGAPSNTGAHADAASHTYDESYIADQLGLTTSDDGMSYQTTVGGVQCDIAVILTDRSMVATYRNAGDPVAVSPDGDAGVKVVSDDERTCLNGLAAKLATMKPQQ